MDDRNARLRALPQLQRLLELPQAARLVRCFSRSAMIAALRAVLDQQRAAPGSDAVPSPDALLELAATLLADAARPGLRRVINATGIVLHTNLGRAPLAAEAVAAVLQVAGGYSNLEYDLPAGERGERLHGVETLLTTLAGAEAALAVNNNAAAVLLALTAIAAPGEVVVSRGELVEIGGGFRIPDVIRQGGARLVEVGTTNRTRLADYAAAITPDTRLLLKVHQSNYRIVGFTAEVGVRELAALGKARGLPVMQDLGSGTLVDPARFGRASEPTVSAALAAGADLVAFSGDKLLGGPQCGVLVGTEAMIAKLRRHPLMRALRLDKLTLAALEATLRLYRDPEAVMRRVPLLRMLAQSSAGLEERARRLAALLPAFDAEVVPSSGRTGGGALPGEAIESFAVSLGFPDLDAAALARRLRLGDPAVVGRIAGGRVLLDMLAVADDEVDALARAIAAQAEATLA